MKVGIVGTEITGTLNPVHMGEQPEGTPVMCGSTEFSLEMDSDARKFFEELIKERPETSVVMIGRPGYTPLSAIGDFKEIPLLSPKLDRAVLSHFYEHRHINGRIAGKIVIERLRIARMRSKREQEKMTKREYQFTGHLSCHSRNCEYGD